MAEYWESKELTELGVEILNNYHEEKMDARFAFIFISKMKKMGKAEKIQDKHKAAGLEADFLIIINNEEYHSLNKNQKKALLDHELTHCEVEEDEESGENVFSIREHTFEEFPEVISRWGAWEDGAEQMETAFRVFRKRKPPKKEEE